MTSRCELNASITCFGMNGGTSLHTVCRESTVYRRGARYLCVSDPSVQLAGYKISDTTTLYSTVQLGYTAPSPHTLAS